MKKKITSKKLLIVIFLIIVIPMLLFLVGYNVITINILNFRILENNKNILNFYEKELESELSKIELSMANITSNNTDFKQLTNKMSDVDAYFSSYNIYQEFRQLQNIYPITSAFYLYSKPNEIYKYSYSEGSSLDERTALDTYVKSLTVIELNNNCKDWYTYKIDDIYYLLRVLKLRETYILCSIDLRYIDRNFEFVQDDGFVAFFDVNGIVYSNNEIISNEKINIKHSKQPYYISGKDNNFFIVEDKTSVNNLFFCYVTPYLGMWQGIEKPQLVLIIASLIIVLLIPICYRLLKNYYFTPLSKLIETMTQIKDGNLEDKTDYYYNIDEFEVANNTFNEMIEKIVNLHTVAYQKEIDIKKAELQNLQLQIRPHFFLNCLKNIYALAQEEKYKDIQELVISLSSYCRYVFRDTFNLIPLSLELESVKNYITLQRLYGSNTIFYAIDVNDSLNDLPIPQMSILTFVENAIKHYSKDNNFLEINIKCRLLKSDNFDYVNITISDNGSGFPENTLLDLNTNGVKTSSGEHLGIENIKQRFKIIYDNKSTVSFYNNIKGACVELIIPYENLENNGGE